MDLCRSSSKPIKSVPQHDKYLKIIEKNINKNQNISQYEKQCISGEDNENNRPNSHKDKMLLKINKKNQ